MKLFLFNKSCPTCSQRTDRVHSNPVVRLTRTVTPFKLTARYCFCCQRRYFVFESRRHHADEESVSEQQVLEGRPPKFVAR